MESTDLLSQNQLTPASNIITFENIAADETSGITYRRNASPRNAIFDQQKQQPVYTLDDIPLTPHKSRGTPGVAIFDYDEDGDLDIYVTNGPGTANSLYSNQLQETGQLTFVDVAEVAGVTATDQDSSGVVYGDTDNDGDLDLMVLGNGDPNQLFENQGDGTFIDITASSSIGGGNKFSGSASMGDVNGDGLLDLVVGNSFTNWDNFIPIFSEPFARNEHNQLFINTGNNVFIDASETSGIQNLAGLPEEAMGSATITWAISMVDYDLDGDLDIIHVDDQGAIRPTEQGGVDRGLIHILQNDGSGNFTDVTVEAGTNVTGGWMGLSFGDFNTDGHMDFFATNFGDYTSTFFPPELQLPLGAVTSRWFLGQSDGSFADPGVGELVATPFGWGTSPLDYDNDGDTDIVYYGSIDQGAFVDASNPGIILQNDGTGVFTYDDQALATAADHTRRSDKGVAVGDLNQDGYVDIVSVSNFDAPETAPLQPYSGQFGSPFDSTAVYIPTFTPTENPGEFVWSGLEFPDGTLAIELNSGNNGNGSIEVEVLGTVGLTDDGSVNRSGIGAVVFFTPDDGQTVMQPILGGSSYLSQDSLAANFGLGDADKGTIEILWPGGVRNRIYDVQAGERLIFPEIPVSFDDSSLSANEYEARVDNTLNSLVVEGTLTEAEAEKFKASAIRAFQEDQLVGTEGNDTIAGLLGNDEIDGLGGDDVLRGDLNERSSGTSEGGNDTINGGTGDDRIGGKGGDDVLYGDAGNDSIWGDDGDDLIRGGNGDDVLTGDDFSGGEGSDTFILAIGEGTDTITDFEVGTDVIGLADSLTFESLSISSIGSHTEIAFGDETLAVLEGVTQPLNESDFVSFV